MRHLNRNASLWQLDNGSQSSVRCDQPGPPHRRDLAGREDAAARWPLRMAALGAREGYGGLRGPSLVAESSRSKPTVARRQGHPAGEDRGQVRADSRARRTGLGRGGLAKCPHQVYQRDDTRLSCDENRSANCPGLVPGDEYAKKAAIRERISVPRWHCPKHMLVSYFHQVE